MNEDKPQEAVVNIRIDQTDLDEVMRKIDRICDLVKETNSLAGELASEETIIKIGFEI